MPGGEKRTHKRVPYSTAVTVRVQSCPLQPEIEGIDFACTTTDISEGGVRLEIDRALPMDCLVELHVNLLEQPFSLVGRVIWSGRLEEHLAYAGVQFPAEFEERRWPWKLQVARVFQSGK